MKRLYIDHDESEFTRDGENIDSLDVLNTTEIVAQEEDCDRCVQLALSLKLDIVIMGIGLPHLNGLLAAQQIKATDSEIRILNEMLFCPQCGLGTIVQT